MKEQQDHVRDIAEIRTMMERSSRFLSLSGWAGVMAGIYALCGAYIAWTVIHFVPDGTVHGPAGEGSMPGGPLPVVFLAATVLVLTIGTAVLLSFRKAQKRGEQIWNATSRRLMVSLAVPLLAGGALIVILCSKGLVGLSMPLTLLFYGIAIYSAGRFTYHEVRSLGLIEIGLGLTSCWFTQYSLLFWAIGFGVVHIVYGVYIYSRYER